MREQRTLRLKDEKTTIFDTLYEGDRIVNDETGEIWVVRKNETVRSGNSIASLENTKIEISTGGGSGTSGGSGTGTTTPTVVPDDIGKLIDFDIIDPATNNPQVPNTNVKTKFQGLAFDLKPGSYLFEAHLNIAMGNQGERSIYMKLQSGASNQQELARYIEARKLGMDSADILFPIKFNVTTAGIVLFDLYAKTSLGGNVLPLYGSGSQLVKVTRTA